MISMHGCMMGIWWKCRCTMGICGNMWIYDGYLWMYEGYMCMYNGYMGRNDGNM